MGTRTFLHPLIDDAAGRYELINVGTGAVLARRIEGAFDSMARRKGLLGRDAIDDDYALIIAPCNSIHTFFMRCAIDAVFVARDGRVLKAIGGLKPWRVTGSLRAHAVIEGAPGLIARSETLAGEVLSLRPIEGPRASAAAGPVAIATEPSPPDAPQPRRTTKGRTLTLARLVASKVPIEWFEGVAIVQELCAAVTARGPLRDQRVPELTEIAISPDGEVKLLGEGPDAQWLVHRVGAVLLALVSEAALPIQLRLLALEEVSPAPRFNSIRELSAELEYFERPDRRQIVRGVFERYMAAMTPAPAASAVPLPLLEPPAPSMPAGRRKSRRRVWAATALGAAALLAAAAVRAWDRPEGLWMRDGARQASVVAGDAARWARYQVSSGFATAKRTVGADAKEPKKPGPGLTFVDPSGASTPRSLPGAELLPATPVPGAGPAGSAAADAAPVGLPGQVESGIWEAIGWLPGTVPPSTAPSAEEAVIFTAADARVVPAGLLQPRLPRSGRAGGDPAALPEVELVISAAGEVESVRLISQGAGARSAMMLSAMKNWRFQPATLNGEPVRFRMRMKLIG
jgi:hypothetical protein